jgi:hypothetical protein
MKTAEGWQDWAYDQTCQKLADDENSNIPFVFWKMIEKLSEKCAELEQQNRELLGALEELAENYCYICSNGKKYCPPDCGELDKYKQLIAKTKGVENENSKRVE